MKKFLKRLYNWYKYSYEIYYIRLSYQTRIWETIKHATVEDYEQVYKTIEMLERRMEEAVNEFYNK